MAVLPLYLLTFLVASTECSSYVFSNTIVIDSGNYNVSYNFNESADTFEFLVEANATGWVAFGFALTAPNSMMNYDVAVGGVLNNGSGYLKDYYTNGFPSENVGPPLDSEQDWDFKNATEQNGVTTLRFCRKRNTTDEKDVAIEQGTSLFIVWAYHSSSDVEPGQFAKHTSKGSRSVTLIPAATSSIMAPMTTSTLASMSASAPAAVNTSTMLAMTTSTPASMSTSAMPAMTTTTTTSSMSASAAIAPSTTTPLAPSSTPVVTPMPAKPVHFANFVSFDNGNYNASWMFNSSTDTLHFMVEVNATGWIGFGVATRAPTGMVGYDVAVGGVFNGSGYLKDYFTNGTRAPPEDSQQDWHASYSSEENGVTTLRFYRKRNTTDQQNDVAIQQGMPMYLIGAYHSTIDVPTMFAKHSFRGSQEVTFIPVATTPTPAPTTPVVTATPTPVHFANFLSLDNGKYNVSWMYESSTDTFHFMVQVRATGWIGFGVATQAPNSMVGYDVAIGGVLSGSGYLKDYFTNGFRAPPEDSQQDWRASYSSEENGVTTLRFYRKRDTNDLNDVVIQLGTTLQFMWAYHSTSDIQPNQFQQHSSRGFQAVAIPAFPLFTHRFDTNRFLLLWRFDDQADKVFYHLRVKTTGWVGFGFAETAPNNMQNYDVIVAGYNNGQGYLWDFNTIGRTRPVVDESQDYKLLNASEADGYTELMFERSPDTKDVANDLAFVPGEGVNIIWAYSSSDANDARTFGVHSNRGWSSEKVVIVPKQPIPTEPSAASTLRSGIYGIVTLTITLLIVLLL